MDEGAGLSEGDEEVEVEHAEVEQALEMLAAVRAASTSGAGTLRELVDEGRR